LIPSSANIDVGLGEPFPEASRSWKTTTPPQRVTAPGVQLCWMGAAAPGQNRARRFVFQERKAVGPILGGLHHEYRLVHEAA